MKRDEWTVKFPATRLIEGCEKKSDYHEGRLRHWHPIMEEAEEELKRTGIQYVEEFVTGGKRIYGKIDPEKSEHYQTAKQKVEKHRARAKEYALWIEFFRTAIANGKPTFELHYDDAEFFGI